MTSTRDSYFDMNFVFPNDVAGNEYNNFNVAFSLTGKDGTALTDDDHRYGKVRARYAQWGLGSGTGYEYIDLHECSEEELGLGNITQNTRFYPAHKNSFNTAKFFAKSMLCPNDKLKIQGDFASEKGRLLQIGFEKCNNETISP